MQELMATITLEYDGRNTIAKNTIEYILSLGVFETPLEKKSKKQKSPYSPKFVKMVLEASKGKTHRVDDVDAFLDNL